MMRSLYIASTGMAAQQMSIEVISHNLANVATTGFKKSVPAFQDLLYQTMRHAGSPTTLGVLPVGVQLGAGVQPISVHKIFSQGSFEERTDRNPLDMAIEGEGFFQVKLPDGSTAYTRTGSFKRDDQGAIMTAEGFPLSPAMTIPPNTDAVMISPEGEVSIKLAATPDTPTVIGTIELANFVNPEGLNSLGKNIYQVTAASGDAVTGLPGSDGFGRLQQGMLESSNVNIADEMVNMITAQRAYELNSKAIQTTDEMMALVNGLKR